MAALLIILLLFAGSTTVTFFAIQRHTMDNVILNLANKLQVTARQINHQASNYQQNAPRDYDTYYRDVRLYYRDLIEHMELFDQITGAFMSGGFPPELTNLEETVYPLTNDKIQGTVNMLEDTWIQYRQGLVESLGVDPLEPRLEYAANYILEHEDELISATDMMLNQVQSYVYDHIETVNYTSWILLKAGGVVVIVLLVWFYLKVLKPLSQSVQGFQRVAAGDFGHQLPVNGHHEFAMMTRAFNHLSQRLNAIFRLLDRLQQGSDVESTVAFVWEEFEDQIPMQWAGLLISSGDDGHLKLAASHETGSHSEALQGVFDTSDTLLQQVLVSAQPASIPNLEQLQDDGTGFQGLLNKLGMGSALLMPLVTPNMQASGILVFASTQADAYDDDHVALLRNIGQLVTHSFWKTVRMVDNTRLAAIGEFASGVAHEIRNPLTTINMAIEYFLNSELPDNARKRAELAASETQRVTRLLEDMLIYAKPLTLKLQRLDLKVQLAGFIQDQQDLFDARRQHAELQAPEQCCWVQVDPDRLQQILLNLASNACDAAPDSATIRFTLTLENTGSRLRLQVQNPGPVIPAAQLAQLTEAFFTTKPGGTGLGLSIVNRLVQAHGGELGFSSDERRGTVASVTLPAAG